MYLSHVLKDSEDRVVCPVLFQYKCDICGATNEDAHTVKHCPRNAGKTSNHIPVLVVTTLKHVDLHNSDDKEDERAEPTLGRVEEEEWRGIQGDQRRR